MAHPIEQMYGLYIIYIHIFRYPRMFDLNRSPENIQWNLGEFQIQPVIGEVPFSWGYSFVIGETGIHANL